MTGAFGTSPALPANLNGHIIYNPVLLHRPLIGIGIGIAPPPFFLSLCVSCTARRSPSRCPPTHSLAHFVQISLVSFFLKAWEKINTRWLALLSLPAAESMRWWGWRAMGIRFSNLHCPFACLLALSLTNLAYHGLTS